MIRLVIRLALVAGLPLTCLAEQKVTAVSVDPVSVYELQKDGLFVRSGKLALNELPLPIPVLEQSPRGYLKVPHNGREVWLDSMDAEVFPPPGIGNSGCVPIRHGSMAAVSRGAGEGCP